ncbi:protein jagunal homolog 1-like isoform X2 [Babylonia areolata]|uniref:protein jagunal homolog 1-like isoform X2 n=1 Tax=Babylonia areolata TaxID=304850 RepID=UPI003FD6486A
MASKYGSRPAGSDGSDHWHRESIAWQYKISSLNKARLRLDVFLHVVLGLLMLVRLAPGLTSLFGFNIIALRRWDMPHPRPWEYAWIFSLVSAVIGWRSTPQNNTFLLKQYMVGTVIFGLLPIIFGILDLKGDMMAYLSERKYTYVMFGMPAVVLWGLFLIICIQLHAFGIYFSIVLLKAWRPRTNINKVKTR